MRKRVWTVSLLSAASCLCSAIALGGGGDQTFIPRCWVVNCKDHCNGTDCVACVMASCGNGQDATWWCDHKYDPCTAGS